MTTFKTHIIIIVNVLCKKGVATYSSKKALVSLDTKVYKGDFKQSSN